MRNFLFPSKPKKVYDPESVTKYMDANWLVQFKLNGSRAIPSATKDKVTIFDRYGSTLTISTERNWNVLLSLFPAPFILDGELIGRKQGEVSNRLYLWDAPVLGGIDLTKKSYAERYAELLALFAGFAKKTCPEAVGNHPFPFLFAHKVGDIEIYLANNYHFTQWDKLARYIGERYRKEGSTGEYEGLVFKDTSHNLAWSGLSTSEITKQLKFLFKYYKG